MEQKLEQSCTQSHLRTWHPQESQFQENSLNSSSIFSCSSLVRQNACEEPNVQEIVQSIFLQDLISSSSNHQNLSKSKLHMDEVEHDGAGLLSEGMGFSNVDGLEKGQLVMNLENLAVEEVQNKECERYKEEVKSMFFNSTSIIDFIGEKSLKNDQMKVELSKESISFHDFLLQWELEKATSDEGFSSAQSRNTVFVLGKLGVCENASMALWPYLLCGPLSFALGMKNFDYRRKLLLDGWPPPNRVQLVDKNLERAITLFWAAINVGDRVDNAQKDIAIVTKQQNQAEEAIEAIKSLRHRYSDQSQGSWDNILLDISQRCGRLDILIALLRPKLQLIQQGLAFNRQRTNTASSQGSKFQVYVDQEAVKLLGSLGWALMLKDNYIEAEDAYRSAFLIGPDINKMCMLGICLMKQCKRAIAEHCAKDGRAVPKS